MKKLNEMSVISPVFMGLLCILLLFGGIGFWAVTSQIAGAVVASGRIEVEQNRQIVQHPAGGVVDEIYVQDGSVVRTGDILIQLDQRDVSSELALIEDHYFETLAQLGYLRAVHQGRAEILFEPELHFESVRNSAVQDLMTAQNTLWRAWVESQTNMQAKTQSQIAQVAAQLAGFDEMHASIIEQLNLIALDLTDQQSLFQRGLAAAVPLRALRREKARLTGALGEVNAARAHSKNRLVELGLAAKLRRSDARELAMRDVQKVRQDRKRLDAERRKLRADMNDMTIRAPVSGVVYDLRVRTPRSVIRRAEPLLYLIPQDRPLLIAAQISPNQIDQVKAGQQVNLRLTSLDQQDTPELQGHVRQISADAIEDARSGMSYFRVEIMLGAAELNRLGPDIRLRLGMPVEVFILSQNRTPMTFLIKPVTDYLARAFRES